MIGFGVDTAEQAIQVLLERFPSIERVREPQPLCYHRRPFKGRRVNHPPFEDPTVRTVDSVDGQSEAFRRWGSAHAGIDSLQCLYFRVFFVPAPVRPGERMQTAPTGPKSRII